ncbi:unnamed protein product [Parnassius apollo]|uniref:(apollo) hypothetical protein n=1 Tax=Parnassius apollo TaxID=110799 RepID=A0A8S3X8M3_PARAO|nr:unnamed protein product [Parnassius apollo]
MLIFFVLCNIVYIPFYINGLNITSEHSVKSVKNILNASFYEDYNKTKINLVSEGGALTPNAAADIVQLPKDKHNILLNLDNEIDKNKEKSVVARKGVVYSSVEDSQILGNGGNKEFSNTSNAYKDIKSSKEYTYDFKNISLPVKSINTTDKSLETVAEKNTHAPKKPSVLSSEALDQITLIVSDQTFSKNGHNIKTPKKPHSHPDMIMPIVITMLVVPMFAVIGYLALKKGQEAWKNRHYKRMDFLLDGMYND